MAGKHQKRTLPGHLSASHHCIPYLQSLLGFPVIFLRSNAGLHVLSGLSIQLLHLRCQLWHILVAQLLAPGIMSISQPSEQ